MTELPRSRGALGVEPIAFAKLPVRALTSTFFRREFDVSEPAAFGWLELALTTEDEVVAHLNGIEVAHTMHLHLLEGTPPRRNHTLVDPSLLVAGRNLLAIELRRRGEPPLPRCSTPGSKDSPRRRRCSPRAVLELS